MVHLKVYELLGFKKVTVAVGLLTGLITTGPGPVSRVHNPVPTAGVLPFNVRELTPQVLTGVWVTEAVVAAADAVIRTVSRVAVQPGVDKLHSNK